MLRKSVSSLALAAVALTASADPIVGSTITGARSFGLANNFVALSSDFSASFWNPAGLAFVPTREFHFSLFGSRHANESELGATVREGAVQKIHLSSMGILRSIPTTRGGFAFAAGYHSPYSLDDVNNFAGADTYIGADTAIGRGHVITYDHADYASLGQLSLWSTAVGWQIAQGLGLGAAGSFLQGREDRLIEFVSHDSVGQWENSSKLISRSYYGYELRLGLLYTDLAPLCLGLRVEIPRWARVLEESDLTDSLSGQRTVARAKGTLSSSFSGAAGVAFALPFATLSSDILFRSPTASALAGKHDKQATTWKMGLGIGAEIPLNPLSAALRAGYSWRELDFGIMRIEWDGSEQEEVIPTDVLTNINLVTGGIALLLGPSVLVEAAYGFSLWQFSSHSPEWANAVEEKHRAHQVLASISIRY